MTGTPEDGSDGKPAVSLSVPRLFLVEDEAMLRFDLAEELTERGYRILTARDGAEALEKLQSGAQFDGILSDIRMPGLDGLDLLVQVRAMLGPDFPFILLSAFSDKPHLNRGMALGATAYLKKPVDYDQLGVLVSRYFPLPEQI